MSIIEAPAEPVVLNETQQALLDAERYMRECGWCQLYGKDSKGRVCIVGAFHYSGHELTTATSRVIYEAIGRTGWASLGIMEWNDEPGRTGDEVLDVLARARELAA